jgi:hypothetical protein
MCLSQKSIACLYRSLREAAVDIPDQARGDTCAENASLFPSQIVPLAKPLSETIDSVVTSTT